MAVTLLTDDYLKGRTARAVPGAYWSREEGGWLFDPGADELATRVALRLFPDLRLSLDPEYLEAFDDDDVRPFDAATPYVIAAGGAPKALLEGLPDDLLEALYPYQAVDLAYVHARLAADRAAYIGWDRGLGKTLGAVCAAYLASAERIVVVCPNSSKESVWRPEFAKWDVDSRYTGRILSLAGPAPKRNRVLAEWAVDGGVLLIHYEALRLVEWAKVPPVDLVIVDEAHRLANGSASAKSPKFYKALKQIRTTYKLALSGSIIVNGPEDFFGANHWLYPQVYRSKWRDWNDKYLHYVEGGFGKVLIGVKPERLDDMRAELGQFTVVRRKEDELPGLPERIEQTLRVELSPQQRRVYDDLAQNFIATLDDGSKVRVGSVLAQLGKLRQVATGLDLLGDSVEDSAKLDLAEQLIQDNLPHKTVVFTWHRATATSLAARLDAKGTSAAVITGDTAMPERARLVEAFQTSPEPVVMVATIKTLGESVTLHAAADVIFLESSWTPTDMEQAADRVYRIGQHRRVTITNIVAADTVDETRVLPTVMDKAAMKRLVLGGN